MNSGNPGIDKGALVLSATECYRKKNFPQSEAICRYLLSADVNEPVIHVLLGAVAQQLAFYDTAISHFQTALNLDPTSVDAARGMDSARQAAQLHEQQPPVEDASTRYLLIKAWGYGFWADVDHVLGQLLLAELTNRTPVVHWGKNSLFGDGQPENAFELYFEPVSRFSINDLMKHSLSFFPPKWNCDNLAEEDLSKWSAAYSRMAGIYYFNQPQTVAVSDFHTYVKDLAPWISESHPMHGNDPQTIYRYLVNKYLRLTPLLKQSVEEYWNENLAGSPTLAIHVRGSDKIHENPNLASEHAQYHQIVSDLLKKQPDIKIFLLTDSKPVLEEFRRHYKGILTYTYCARSDSETGVHHDKTRDSYATGKEVVKDVYLAARCDYFLGTGSSNVSTSVLHLKEWGAGKCGLIGHNYLFGAHLGLHNW